MRIGIVVHPYGEKNPAGLGRVILEWTRALISADSESEYMLFTKDKLIPPDEFSGNNWKPIMLGGGYFWLDKILRCTKDLDVVVFNTPILPLFGKPKKSIVIALDFAYQFFPSKNIADWIRKICLKWYHGYSLRRADMIVAISEATKNDIIKIYGISEKKICVIYPGFTNICALPPRHMEVPEKFFLFIGALKERKNVHGVIRAFAEYKRLNLNAKESLCIAGSGEGEYKEFLTALAREFDLERGVCFLGRVSDEELSFLYKKAIALVFPSFIEGFGFPVLEAMACGIPVITSNIASLPELAGGSALLVNPYNIQEIEQAMAKLLFDVKLRAQLKAQGIEQVKNFSWEKAGKEMLSLIYANANVIKK